MNRLLQIVFAIVILTAAFLMRALMFLYRPLTGHVIEENIFWVCAYLIPELLPAAYQVYIGFE